MWNSVQLHHLEKKCIAVIAMHTEQGGCVDLSICNHSFSSLISISNEGSNITDPRLSVPSIQMIVVQPTRVAQ